MENVRAYILLIRNSCCDEITSVPANPETDSAFAAEIVRNGFRVICKPSHSLDDVLKTIEGAPSIKTYEVLSDESTKPDTSDNSSGELREGNTHADLDGKSDAVKNQAQASAVGVKQSLISVNQTQLAHLMDLVGEIVTAESMVARNPDIAGLRLDNFTKSVRELRKLTDELQDIVMSIRMVPLLSTFHKMDRIVRDLSKKLEKKAELITEGEIRR